MWWYNEIIAYYNCVHFFTYLEIHIENKLIHIYPSVTTHSNFKSIGFYEEYIYMDYYNVIAL